MVSVNGSGNLNTENQLRLTREQARSSEEVSGSFDKTSGVFSLSIPNLGSIEITGLPSIDSIGRGPEGERGSAGKNGENGTIKSQAAKGKQGERGISGDRGIDGDKGYRGYKGNQGDDGDIGNTGGEGQEGHIPFFIQEEDPGNVAAGTLWVKRLPDIKRDEVNVASPRLILPDVTVYKNESRIVKVRVNNNLEESTRYEIKPVDDTYIEIEHPVVLTSSESDIEVDQYAFRVKIKSEIDDNEQIKDFKPYTTEIEVYIENRSGNDTQKLALTILPELRN